MNIARGVGKNKELFLDYGAGYWAEGTFEDYLAEREERNNDPGEGPQQQPEQGAGELTYGSDTG